ncbi:hypothetical protein MSAN_01848000 [Mycena sanguinolenta]|uniref:Uncharacterized protein n=1 Tax=Mycena sanguinolenta TaxID=230812 RepID=A0A8H7CS76_9AGAR|nr:hypothetical protein MSAN_01848000 [Mycena sanguinolenta]
MAGFFASWFQWLSRKNRCGSLPANIETFSAIVGLQASGKTSFVNVIGSGQWSEDVVPTVGFIFKKVRKGNVTLKIWDVAGTVPETLEPPHNKPRAERYCHGADAIVFILDSADASPCPYLDDHIVDTLA